MEEKYQVLTEQAENRELIAKSKIEEAKRTLNMLQPDTLQYQTNKQDAQLSQKPNLELKDDLVDTKTNKFKATNKHGHASDSQMKDILYNSTPNSKIVEPKNTINLPNDQIPSMSNPNDNSSIDLMEVDNDTNDNFVSNNDVELMDMSESFNLLKEEVEKETINDEMQSTPIKPNICDQSTEKDYRSGIFLYYIIKLYYLKNIISCYHNIIG